MGINPQAGHGRVQPPLSAPHFITALKARTMSEKERDLVIHEYRAAVEDGFNHLEKLSYSRVEWTDDDVKELAWCFEEVPCPNVLELDLSWNDMKDGSGLESIGHAIGLGALHGLQRLNLINCTAIKTLPGTLGELLELNTILLDGCVQLKELPKDITKLASLKYFSIVNCHYLDDDALKGLPGGCAIIRTKEEKASIEQAAGVQLS